MPMVVIIYLYLLRMIHINYRTEKNAKQFPVSFFFCQGLFNSQSNAMPRIEYRMFQ